MSRFDEGRDRSGAGVAGLGRCLRCSRARTTSSSSSATAAPGGHATRSSHDGLALDTGFIVHNEPNYPLLTRLLPRARRRARSRRRCPSRSAAAAAASSTRDGGRSPSPQRRRPGFLALLAEIGRWLRTARRSLEDGDCERATLAEYLDRGLLASASAATSSCRSPRPSGRPRPAARSSSRPRTRSASSRTTGCSGSAASAGGRSRAAAAATSTRSLSASETACTSVSACARCGVTPTGSSCAPTTTPCTGSTTSSWPPTPTRRSRCSRIPRPTSGASSGGFEYTSNEAVLHTDAPFLPRAPRARSSWNYRLGEDGRPTITYHLNRLQALAAGPRLLPHAQRSRSRPSTCSPASPTPTRSTRSRRSTRSAGLPRLAGSRTHYAGAHFGNGFHEDGLASGVAAARALGVAW